MKKDILRQWTVIVTYLIMIAANVLAEALPLNGQTTKQISDSFNVIFVPAGYVFSIWGVIYLALLAFTVYQALPKQRQNPIMRQIGYLFAISNLINAAWIVLWHFNLYLLTMVDMIALLVLLIIVYLKINRNKSKWNSAESWLVKVPFSIYLGWITVATIANATAVFANLGFAPTNYVSKIITVALLGIGVILAGSMSWLRKDFAYPLVLIWAFIGLGVKWMGTIPSIMIASFVAAGIIFLDLLLSLFLKQKPAMKRTQSKK
jgi:benzodiazapine receptor